VRKRPAALACAGFVAVAVAIAMATATTETGCTTHQCDSSSYDYVNGFMLDDNTFVTTDMNSPGIDYRGMTTIRIWFPKQVLGRIPTITQVTVGTDPTMNGGDSFDDADISTNAAGQLAEYNELTTTRPPRGPDGGPTFFTFDGGEFGGFIEVTNASCASYFAWVTVLFAQPGEETADGGPNAAAPDAGLAEPGAVIADAALEAGSD
jgi:hypothetical protein